MKKTRLSVSEHRILDRLVAYGMKAPTGVESLPAHSAIKILRHGLGMTQTQLAKRAGLTQSHLAGIEQGRVDLQLSTLHKIFRAMDCETLLFPRFKQKPEAMIAQRAKEVARKKVARVSGSMALEKQLPDQSVIRELIKAEEKRLKDKPSSEIWEE